jgi:ribonuclease P protein component
MIEPTHRHIAPTMIRFERDIDLVFRGGKRLRHPGRVPVRFALRDLGEGESAVMFIFIVPKRSVRRANQRNTIKRWLREAIIHCAAHAELIERSGESKKQILVSIKIDAPPSAAMRWDVVVGEVEGILGALLALLQKDQGTGS